MTAGEILEREYDQQSTFVDRTLQKSDPVYQKPVTLAKSLRKYSLRTLPIFYLSIKSAHTPW